MKLKILMIVSSIVSFLFGISFLFAPAWTEASYGVNLDAGGQLIARFLGSAYLGIAALLWFGRNSPNPETRRPIILGMFVTTALGFIVAIYDRLMGIENALAWSTVAIFLILGIGFGYFAFRKTNAE